MGQRLTDFEAEDRILESLRSRDGVATAGDVAADTGLSLEKADQVLRQMVHYYKSHLDVDDEGNLLYRFDPEFERRGEEPGRLWHDFKKKAATVGALAFKGWIMVMLIGYTVAFIALLLALAIAGIAAAMSDSEGGGLDALFLPFYAVLRVLEIVFWISLFDSTHGHRTRRVRGRGGTRAGRGLMGRGMGGSGRTYQGGGIMNKLRGGVKTKQKPSEPLYKKIFRYVFGPESDSDPLAAEKAFARFVRENDGRVTAADWAARTGSSLEDAESALTASAMRFDGDVNVAEDGTLVYAFDELRVTSEAGTDDEGEAPDPVWDRPVKLPSLTGKNSSKANTWITLLNGFNLMMGGAVVASAVTVTSPLAIGLGWIPLVFSTLFFAVPGARRLRRRFQNKRVARENERRNLIEAVYLSAEDGEANRVDGEIFESSEVGEDVTRDFDAEVEVDEDGEVYYRFPRVARQIAAGNQARDRATAELVFGQTIFSSDEEEMTLEEAEMEEFDRRLSNELGGDVELEFDEKWRQLEESVARETEEA